MLSLLSIMKVPGSALAVLLCTTVLYSQVFSASLTQAHSAPSSTAAASRDEDTTNTLSTCCFSFVSRKIPRKFITDYLETSSLCPRSAVIFQTTTGREICADPSETWVQKYIADLELNA